MLICCGCWFWPPFGAPRKEVGLKGDTFFFWLTQVSCFHGMGVEFDGDCRNRFV